MEQIFFLKPPDPENPSILGSGGFSIEEGKYFLILWFSDFSSAVKIFLEVFLRVFWVCCIRLTTLEHSEMQSSITQNPENPTLITLTTIITAIR